MTRCSGREIPEEVLYHLSFDEAVTARVLENSIVVPSVMPYITSQFLVRRHGDRPRVVPRESVNLAFIGQFAEVPDDVVFTVEYSVRTAWTAVAELLGLDRRPPEVYKGHHDPHVLREALEIMHRHETDRTVPRAPSQVTAEEGEPWARPRGAVTVTAGVTGCRLPDPASYAAERP